MLKIQNTVKHSNLVYAFTYTLLKQTMLLSELIFVIQPLDS